MTARRLSAALPSLEARLVDMAFLVAGGVVVWWLTQGFAAKANQLANTATKPAGQALSDLMATLNGWQKAEMTPLMIRDFYLTDDWRLTPEADKTLWNWQPWHPALNELFGGKGGQMKPGYRSLVNKEIRNDFNY